MTEVGRCAGARPPQPSKGSNLSTSTTQDGSSGEATGLVHKIGDGEIIETTQGKVTIFVVRGKEGNTVLSFLERMLLRSSVDVGLDLRELRGPGRQAVAFLRKMNRTFRDRDRALLLYEPPSRIIDQLKLSNTLQEFNIFTEANGLVASQSAARPGAGEEQQKSAGRTATREIVQFTKSLERVDELETSLDTASQRSLRMLQVNTPEFPPFEISTSYYPHDKVGGDFYSLLQLDDDHLGITVGDVSGHGLEAALIMGMAKKVFDIRAREGSRTDPASVMHQVNEDLFDDLDRFTFLTGFYAIIQRSTGALRYCRAGHNYPLLISPSRGEIKPINSPGLAIGMDPGPGFRMITKSMEDQLLPGDFLLVYTDGLTEAAHPRRGQFGLERVTQFFREQDLRAPAEELKPKLLEEVQRFLDDTILADDMTVILLKYAADNATPLG